MNETRKDSGSSSHPASAGAASSGASGPVKVPIAWEALEDAFENNAPEVHSYLHLGTGEVIRIVDGIADPGMHARVMSDAQYLRIDPVSSREQYRWMERFIATVEDGNFRAKLLHSIDGKGAFRRFKDVLMNYPVDRERWFVFRSERLRACMESWVTAHGLEVVQRPKWRVPTADEVKPTVDHKGSEPPSRRSRATVVEAQRHRLRDLVESLPVRELDAAVAYLEFLGQRKHTPRPRAKVVESSMPPAANTSGSVHDPGSPKGVSPAKRVGSSSEAGSAKEHSG